MEVKQSEIFTLGGARSVELEGISKNIAARTMSICLPGQVLLTKEAIAASKGRMNHWTPRGSRYACVGEYRFRGVKETQIIYAGGETIESLQPPPSSDKVKRIGGPKKIKSRMRDKKLREWLWWFTTRTALMILLWLVSILAPIIIDPHKRLMSGLTWFDWIDPLVITLQAMMDSL